MPTVPTATRMVEGYLATAVVPQIDVAPHTRVPICDHDHGVTIGAITRSGAVVRVVPDSSGLPCEPCNLAAEVEAAADRAEAALPIDPTSSSPDQIAAILRRELVKAQVSGATTAQVVNAAAMTAIRDIAYNPYLTLAEKATRIRRWVEAVDRVLQPAIADATHLITAYNRTSGHVVAGYAVCAEHVDETVESESAHRVDVAPWPPGTHEQLCGICIDRAAGDQS